jgi:hypothetical protein
MRLSSARLKVTLWGGSGAVLRSGPRLSLGSLSPDTELIGASCHLGDMIHPSGDGCKQDLQRF